MSVWLEDAKRVLVIDNDYADQKIIEVIFRRCNINIDQCLSATAAPPKIQKNGYDAILLDYELDKMNGIELLKNLQQKIHCPVYIISCHDEDFIKSKIVSSDVKINGFISKMSLRKNLRVVEEMLFGKQTF